MTSSDLNITLDWVLMSVSSALWILFVILSVISVSGSLFVAVKYVTKLVQHAFFFKSYLQCITLNKAA